MSPAQFSERENKDESKYIHKIEISLKTYFIDVSVGEHFAAALTSKGELYIITDEFLTQKLH